MTVVLEPPLTRSSAHGNSPAPHLMAQLADLRRAQNINRDALADHLGVASASVMRWEEGRNSPKLRDLVAYAEFVGRCLVLRAGQLVVAEGLSIAGAFPALRWAAGLTQRQLAARLHVRRSTVAAFETRGCTQLASLEVYAAAMGLTFGLEGLNASEVEAPASACRVQGGAG